jgi:hypothetical protein
MTLTNWYSHQPLLELLAAKPDTHQEPIVTMVAQYAAVADSATGTEVDEPRLTPPRDNHAATAHPALVGVREQQGRI